MWQSPRKSTRWVLCRPRGGLNDVLCQIEKCWAYAERYQRGLVIDPPRETLVGDVLGLLEPRAPSIEVVIGLSQEALQAFNTLSTLPTSLSGRLGHYTTQVANFQIADEQSGQPLTFDFGRDHPADLLVHHQYGGGQDSHRAITRLMVRPDSVHRIRHHLPELPLLYDSVHLRHTDYRSRYEAVLSQLSRRSVDRPLLVCSDSSDVLRFARGMKGRRPILTFPDHPLESGVTLHGRHSLKDEEGRVAAANRLLAEILAMSGSRVFSYGPVYRKPDQRPPHTYSGFSRLVGHLVRNREVTSLLFGEDLSIPSPPVSGKTKAQNRWSDQMNNPIRGWAQLTSLISRARRRLVTTFWYPKVFAWSPALSTAWNRIRTARPRSYRSKVHYKMARDRRPLLTTFTDKLTAREYVASRIGRERLSTLHSVSDSFENLDLGNLPREFVLKVNHACGGVVIVTDCAPLGKPLPLPGSSRFWSKLIVHPDDLDWSVIGDWVRTWLSHRYRWNKWGYYEWAYSGIEPRVYIEEYLGGELGFAQTVKVHCIYGEAVTISLVDFDTPLQKDSTQLKFFPEDIDEFAGEVGTSAQELIDITHASETLSQETDFVRVDWILAPHRMVFNEFTSYPAGGQGNLAPSNRLSSRELSRLLVGKYRSPRSYRDLPQGDYAPYPIGASRPE